MKHTIAVNRQLFNVKKIASGVKIDNLKDGEFGVFAIDSDTSLTDSTVFADLPKEFHIISKLNGETYYGFDTIKKADMLNFQTKEYKKEVINVWEGEITGCSCIETVALRINLEEDNLIRERGLSWSTNDRHVVSIPYEHCGCDKGKPHLGNHYATRELYAKILADGSDYYEVEVKVKGGSVFSGLETLDAFIEANKEKDGVKNLVLVIKGKKSSAVNFSDFGPHNYIYPRGVKLNVSATVNGDEKVIPFKEVIPLEMEMNSGAELKADEWDAMEYYTNGFRFLADGTPTGEVKYQFEFGKEYKTVNFEFHTKKVDKNAGDKRSFGVLLGTEDASVFAKLKAMFVPKN